jgi:hypothetical protein
MLAMAEAVFLIIRFPLALCKKDDFHLIMMYDV